MTKIVVVIRQYFYQNVLYVVLNNQGLSKNNKPVDY